MQNQTPATELRARQQKAQRLLGQEPQEFAGALLFSRLAIYYFTGSISNGVLWLPSQGKPTLFCKKGLKRAELETSEVKLCSFRSFSEIVTSLEQNGELTPKATIAAEKNALSWPLAENLQKYFKNYTFASIDRLLAYIRSVKSPYELAKMEAAGTRHNRVLCKVLPQHLRAGISEFDIARITLDLYLREGHAGILRMQNFGEELFFGHVAIGDSANHPSVFNGPVGLTGCHPSTPFMGSADIFWQQKTSLIIDNGFCFEGYQTDKTQVYWLGKATIPDEITAAHDFCREIQEDIRLALKPGEIPEQIYLRTIQKVAASPYGDGFMGFTDNKVSFIGHGIGLAVDEYPVIANKFNAPLEDNMTLAIEPKISIPGVGMVGVENTFVVGKNGGRSLTGVDDSIITIAND